MTPLVTMTNEKSRYSAIPASLFGFNLRSSIKNAPLPYLGQLIGKQQSIKDPQSTNYLIARHTGINSTKEGKINRNKEIVESTLRFEFALMVPSVITQQWIEGFWPKTDTKIWLLEVTWH